MMSFVNIKLSSLSILIFYFSFFSVSLSEINKLMYPKNGRGKFKTLNIDWPGSCSLGKFQSPINIIDGVNTIEDSNLIIKIDSVISFDYKIPEGGDSKKFIFDGERLFLDINLGNIAFFNKRGSKEIYNAYRIELHFPSEHYVTMHNQTPRYALEIQIFHHFAMSTNYKVTNQVLKVNKAVVSLLYTVGSSNDGDEFLEQLAISRILIIINKDTTKIL